ncbi:MAG: hypothetical protein LC722_02345 [Actinobacteria bacterium]|nr:hypothetical protein [Actinomycetota bacterium]
MVPRVTYTDPEVASVGMTEEQAHIAGHAVKVGLARFDGSTRAFLEGEETGFVKLVADARTNELLGGHIVGPAAGELIHQVVIMMATRSKLEDVARAIHAYPTFSQTVRSAWADLIRNA